MNQRRLAIIRMLDSRKKVTARELAEQFGVSVRTIQRDLDALQDLGFPLYAEAGAHGGYRVLPNRMLPPLYLNLQEALGLYLMLGYLEEVPDFPYGAVRGHLAEQYFASLPGDVRERIKRVKDHIAFPQRGRGPQSPLATTDILSAAMEKTAIDFTYESRSGSKRVQAYPLGLYYDKGWWYMPARREERILLYRVDRMSDVTVVEELTDLTLPTLKEWFAAPDDRDHREVVLAFTEFGARLAASDTLLPSMIGNEWRGRVPAEEFPFMARRLLAYGPEVVVREPAVLRDMLKDLLERGAAQYREL